MKMKRFGVLLLCLAAFFLMTACAANSAAPTPTPMITPVPPATENPMVSPTPLDESMVTAAMTGAESSAFSKKANDIAQRISEVDSCVTAIIGDTCVAGIKFDGQYQGELTDRIRDMVAARIQSAVPTLERVIVTSDPAILSDIGTIAEKISKADAVGALAGELDTVIGKIQ